MIEKPPLCYIDPERSCEKRGVYPVECELWRSCVKRVYLFNVKKLVKCPNCDNFLDNEGTYCYVCDEIKIRPSKRLELLMKKVKGKK